LKIDDSCGKYPIPFKALLCKGREVISLSSKKTFPDVGFTNPQTV
jgi:hypothetical protein